LTGLFLSTGHTQHAYLLFVRAGRDSLHRKLLAENPDRNWDCCVSWYVEPQQERGAEYYCDGGFNKLDGFLEFWRTVEASWRYRYVMLLDDDLYLRPRAITQFFELCDRYSTYLSQPAQRWFTHTTLNSLVRNPACLLRRVSFVEVMAPCFSTAALRHLIHTFQWTRSTWGIDWAWGALLEGHENLHVVDAVGLEHTRTGDGRPTAFYAKLKASGIDPGEELRSVRARFPGFEGPRTLGGGHVFRTDLPRWLAPAAMFAFERLKFIVRIRKQILRNWRLWRARVQDAASRDS